MAGEAPRNPFANANGPGIVSDDTVYVLRRDHPQIQMTWASKFPSKVDKLKLRKAVTFFPVKVTLKADYDTNTREFDYGCSARVRTNTITA
jgi:hypothetical protein